MPTFEGMSTPSSGGERQPRSALEQQWAMMDLPVSGAHSPELATVLQMIGPPGSIAEVVAAPGMGKTALLKMAAEFYRQQFGGVVEFIDGGRAFNPQDAIELIASSFRAAAGQSLRVIDSAEELDTGDILATVNRLGTGPWSFSTLVGTRMAKDVGHRLTLQPFARNAIAQLLAERIGDGAPSDTIDRLLQASRGVPLFAEVLVDQLRGGATLEDIESLVAPWRATGLIGPDGQPLSGHPNGRRLFTDVRLISNELIDHLSRFPDEVYGLTSRQFEELTAELLNRQGYEVELTSETRDGGKDLYAVKKDGLGSFLFLVECKRYAAEQIGRRRGGEHRSRRRAA
ncbi:MAG: restriction endonuclease [Kaiparowitsia implicata GSE-PSE-MK54-09C]|jgi:restriction system protein|nr:restriction endonuclease [Kaiparowitsia implicata GSE-PSE-MK54-09C]